MSLFFSILTIIFYSLLFYFDGLTAQLICAAFGTFSLFIVLCRVWDIFHVPFDSIPSKTSEEKVDQ